MSLTRIGSIGINTGIAFAGVTTIVTLNTANDALSIGATVNVGSGITLGASGDIFATGVSTFSGNLKVGSGITLSPDGDVFFTGIITGNGSGLTNLATDLVNDTTPQLGGNLDNNGKNITFGDSAGSSDDRLTFGAGTDLSIYHDNSNSRSRIEHSTDNALEILQGGNAGMLIQNQNSYNIEIKTNAEDAIKCVANGAVELYYDNSLRLATDANGIHVTTNIHLNDNGVIEVGTGSDLTIQHDGSNTRLKNDTGQLQLRSNAIVFENAAGSSFADIQSHFRMIDNKKIHLGSDTDASIYHEGSWNYIKNFNSKNFAIQIKDGTENAIIAVPDGEVQLYHDNTKQCETSANGLAFPSGKGIDFSATGDGSGASGVSELLDDYEEGTFTVTLANSLTVGQQTTLSYTKIGNKVHISGQFKVTSGGSDLIVSNLPFTTKNTGGTDETFSTGICGLYNVTFPTDGSASGEIITKTQKNDTNMYFVYNRTGNDPNNHTATTNGYYTVSHWYTAA